MVRNAFPGRKAHSSSVVVAALLAAMLGGCSADVMRFDAPGLGLGSSSEPPPRAPLHPDGSLFDQRPPASGTGSGGVYGPGATTGSVARAPLPNPEPPRLEPRTSAPRTDAPRPSAGTYPLEPDRPRNRTAFFAPRRTPAPPATPSDAREIVVKPGDTLYVLARRHGVTVADLKAANGLTSNTIRPGQKLVLRPGAGPESPAPRRVALTPPPAPVPPVTERAAPRAPSAPEVAGSDTYTIRPGDNLYGIARRKKIKVATLMRINGITDARKLRPGMVLRLTPSAEGTPGGGPTPAPTRVAAPPATAPVSPAPPAGAVTGRSTNPRVINEGAAREPAAVQPRRVKSVPIPVTEEPVRRSETKPAPQARTTAPPASTTVRTAKVEERRVTTTSDKFRWPVRGRIVRNFGVKPDGTKNDGIDIAVPFGAEVHAAEAGVVAYAGDELKGYGNLVLIRHDNGWVSAYAHNELLLVKRGDTVTRGQVIAKAGKTGDVKKPTVHFELRQGSRPVDPVPHLAKL